MDNLTHSLVGLAAAKSGLERLSPGATALCVLAANSPDADIVVLLFRDRWSFLQHHRGITHALVGTFVLSVLLPVLFLVGDFINAIISFLLIAAAVYFFVVVPVNWLMARMHKEEPTAAPTTKKCPECLSEIPLDAKRCAHCTQPVMGRAA